MLGSEKHIFEGDTAQWSCIHDTFMSLLWAVSHHSSQQPPCDVQMDKVLHYKCVLPPLKGYTCGAPKGT